MPSSNSYYTQDEADPPTTQSPPAPLRVQKASLPTPSPTAPASAQAVAPTPPPSVKTPPTGTPVHAASPSTITYSAPDENAAAPQAIAPARQAAPAQSRVAESAPKTFEQELLMLINESRAQANLAPLHLNKYESKGDRQCVGSHGHSVHMAQAKGISHDQFPADVCLTSAASAENVGMATGDEQSALMVIHNGMMAEGTSGGHYRNIMSADYDSVGIGLYYSGGALWLTEDFMYLGVDQIASTQR